ncbi:DUF5134 domain-containing protein [Plantactinospora sp. KBS50]|uniref:DUF5134 domain-containing protein n=1 Tax=Plantactinospora sp. KBS50 TaxID=2024580 RepID=UPI000BAA9AC0|nr:DUF5134 domain-containing protein [Plantactinospora sp. KBS50]ASW53420.1 hypothetical protein CIK06_03300 [Plantactinospora sp. KBS50]
MTGGWIPAWAANVWSVLFFVIALVHGWHLAWAAGQARFWHLAHLLMALGMMDMFWPAGRMPVGAVPGEIIFGVAAVAVLGFIAVAVIRRTPPAAAWLLTAFDLAAMVYMFALMSTRFPAAITVLLAAAFVVESAGWATGKLVRTAPAHATAANGQHHGGEVLSMRISLALMGLGMAYMLLAMQFGTDMGSNMPGMPGMPGM